MLSKIFNGKYDAHQTFLALGETLAHLHLLEAQGRITRTTDGDGIESFIATPGVPHKLHHVPGKSHPDFQEV